MTIKKKTVHYRQCAAFKLDSVDTDVILEPFKLQKALTDAIPLVPLPWKRKLPTDNKRAHHLTHLVNKNECLCGVFALCDSNKKVILIDTEADGKPWKGVSDPKDDSGKKRELQEQELFFAIRDNHIAIIHPLGLGLKELHEFFNWFIQTQAAVAQGWFFVFQNVPSEEAKKKLGKKKIHAVKVGLDAFKEEKTPIPRADGDSTKKQRFTKTIKTEGIAKQFLSGLVDEAILENLSKATDIGQIWIALEIKYRSKNIKDSQQLMHAIAATVGDRPELTSSIDLGDGDLIKGELLTISGEIKVQSDSGKISDDDAMTRLSEWLTTSIQTGKIPV